jgi:SNF2 family DNA or RNA helicase
VPGDRNRYVVYKWNLREDSKENIYNRISDICISMKSEDYLELPERIDNAIEINLPTAAKGKYKQLERDLVLELGADDITAANAAVLTNKLLQMANGAIYSETHDVVEIHEEKLKALLDVIEAANGKPVLIFYNFRHDLNRIVEFLKKNKLNAVKLNDSEDIKKWNSGETPILLTHPASAGHGLNLQAGGHIIVWFGLTWSLELYQQANARLHRQGQTENVIIHHLVAKGTVDEDVMKALGSKEVNQNMLLEAVKARIKKYKEDTENESM